MCKDDCTLSTELGSDKDLVQQIKIISEKLSEIEQSVADVQISIGKVIRVIFFNDSDLT